MVNLARFQSQKQRNNFKPQSDWQVQGNAVLNQRRHQIHNVLGKSSHVQGKENGNERRNFDWEEGNRRNEELKTRQGVGMGNWFDWDNGNRRNHVLKQRQGLGMGYRFDRDKGNRRNQVVKQRQEVDMGRRSDRGNQKPKEVWIWRRKNVMTPQSDTPNRHSPKQFHHASKVTWAKEIKSINAKDRKWEMNGSIEV